MTLDEQVKLMDDKDILYIGSASSFFFIGTKELYEDMIDGLSIEYLERSNKYLKNANDFIERAKVYVPQYEEGTDLIDYSVTLLNYATGIKKSVKSKAREEKYQLTFKPFRERFVRECQPRIQGGYGILVEGTEYAPFWTENEFKSV